MKICISTFGSTGDHQPYIALGLALQRAGHEVVFMAACHFHERIQKLGLQTYDYGPVWNQQKVDAISAAMIATTDPGRQIELMYEQSLPELLTAVPPSLALLAECDLLINHNVNVSAAAAAIKLGKPMMTGHLFPTLIETPQLSPLGGSLGSWPNRFLWFLVRQILRRKADPYIHQVFDNIGLPRQQDYLTRTLHSPLLNLVAISPALLPAETGWPSHYQTTGYWFLEEPSFRPDESLERFLSSGEPPVLVSFGSMSGFDVTKQTEALVEGARRAKVRMLLQAGWSGLGGSGELPENVYRIGVVPHSWLLPRVAAVMHHGGAGTTAAVLRAGVPQSVVWHLGDQSMWGKIVQAKGVGVAPIRHTKLTATWAEKTLQQLTQRTDLKQKAAAMGENIRAEDGLGNAVRAIEDAYAQRKRGS
jgi:sterol 3beta-glucosyltransferase